MQISLSDDLEAELACVGWPQRDVLVGTLRSPAQLDACIGFDEPVEGIGGEATVRIAVLQNLIINGAHLAVEHVRHLTDLLQLMHRIGARRADLQICVDGEN